MALALYRKYRPQTFRDITNQNHVKITLEQQVARGKVAHAYLFSGPRGTGKTSIARILAKAVNCTSRGQRSEIGGQSEGEPCNACAACEAITSGRALDVIEIDAASHTGVDNVRETIVETAKFAPSSFKYKLFIIDEAHMLSTSAWNALLKIMEEPPAHVIFVLATTEVHKVPATILSRCQRFDFHRIRLPDLVERLKFIASQEKVRVAIPVLQAVARMSEGCVRDGESVLEQLLALGEKEITEDLASLILPRTSIVAVLDLLEAVEGRETRRGLELVNKLFEQGIDFTQFAGDSLEILRKVLLVKIAGAEQVAQTVDAAALERVKNLAEKMKVERILSLIEIMLKAKQGLRGAVIPQLPLEVGVVEACGVGDGLAAPAGNAVSQLQGGNRSVTPPPLLWNSPVPTAVGTPRSASSTATTEINRRLRAGSNSPRGGSRADAPVPSVELSHISLEEIKKKWPEVVKMVQKENHSLPFLLSTSEVVGVAGDTVRIGVQYPFHCDKLNEPKAREVLEKILAEHFNAPLKVFAIVREKVSSRDAAIEDVLSTLGGKVVE